MPNRHLGRTITMAFVAFGVTLTIILGWGMVGALKSVEMDMLDDTLRAELVHFRSQQGEANVPTMFSSRTTLIHVAPLRDDSHIPEYLRELAVGTHDIERDDRNYRVLVEQAGSLRYIVQFDDTDIQRRETRFIQIVWLLSLSVLVSALLIGGLIAHRVSAPLTRLAQELLPSEGDNEKLVDATVYENNEIGFLAGRIRNYQTQLNRALEREREFAGNVSHELRTPITNICLAAEVIALNPRLTQKDKDRIHRIQRAAHEMTELVETFLVLAKDEGPETNGHSTCDVNAIVKEVVEQQRVWLNDKPVDVVVNDMAPLAVNAPIRVVAVLVANLVRNAYRYTERGKVTITLRDNCLIVEDTGPGIDSVTRSQLFSDHAISPMINPDGYGLGLAIVRRICERFGWRPSVENRHGAGSVFSIAF